MQQDRTKCCMCSCKVIHNAQNIKEVPLCEKHYMKLRNTPQDRNLVVKVTGSKEKGVIKSDRSFACELECIAPNSINLSYAMTQLPDKFGVKGDGSISYGCYTEEVGREIPTNPLRGKLGEQTLIDACTLLTDVGFKVNVSCGTHCHIGVPEGKKTSVKNESLLKNLAMFYTIFEPVIRGMLTQERRSNTYCSPMRSKYIKIDNDRKTVYSETVEEKRFDKIFYNTKEDAQCKSCKSSHSVQPRYGINFNSVYYRGTLEVRYHEGTLDPVRLIHWIAIHSAIIDIVMSGKIQEKQILECAQIDNLKELFEKLIKILGIRISRSTVKYSIDRFNECSKNIDKSEILKQYVNIKELEQKKREEDEYKRQYKEWNDKCNTTGKYSLFKFNRELI